MKLSFTVFLFLIFSVFINAQNFEWAKQIGGTSNDFANSIAVDAYGNVYTTGIFQETVDFDPGVGIFNLTSAGGEDIFITRMDLNGNFIWAKTMGGIGLDLSTSITIDQAGNVYITGRFSATVDFDPDSSGNYNMTSVGNTDIFISKLDANGNFIWAKQMGGPEHEIGSSITTDSAGNVYITGYFGGTADFDPGSGTYNLTSAGSNDIFISKLDASGNFIWAKQKSGTFWCAGRSIAIDAEGYKFTTGHFSGTADFDPSPGINNLISAGLADIYISKLDSNGNLIWAKSLGGSAIDYGSSIGMDAGGYIYITGFFDGIVDFDPNLSGNYYLTSAGGSDIYILKLDANGNFLWAKSMGGSLGDEGNSIAIDAGGNIYTTGYFRNTADFDPGSIFFNLTSAGSFDIFISKLDSSGNFLWANSMGGSFNDFGLSIAIDTAGNVYTTGYFNGTANFDPDTGIFNMTSAGSGDIFVHKISQCTPTTISSNISSTPSYFTAPNCDGTVSVTSFGGTPPYTVVWNSGTTTNLCEGWYTVTITDANNCVKTDIVYVNFVTGIEELHAAGISVYPNPVNDVITITSLKEIGQVKIFDVNGKLILKIYIPRNEADIDLKYFESGIYFLENISLKIKILKQ
ncbi:MAG: SBBP repeat-containing protein [Bacteroidia bacterium]